jgi:LPXTG-motif cell wall-anchored protein
MKHRDKRGRHGGIVFFILVALIIEIPAIVIFLPKSGEDRTYLYLIVASVASLALMSAIFLGLRRRVASGSGYPGAR